MIGPKNLERFENVLPSLDIKFDESDFKYCDAIIPPGNYGSNLFNTSNWMR